MKRIGIAILCGAMLTTLLTLIAFIGNSRSWGFTFAWQACLTQMVIHTPDNPIHEASPIDLLGFALGVLLGVPIYSIITYGYLKWSDKNTEKRAKTSQLRQ